MDRSNYYTPHKRLGYPGIDKDEWYYISFYRIVFTSKWDCIGSYKCDQLTGLIECIKDILKIK